jgi:glutathione S-transferase
MSSAKKLTLYDFYGSCSIVPAILLQHLHIPHESVRISHDAGGLFAADNSFTNAEYRTLHADSKVPCLRIPLSPETGAPALLATTTTRPDDDEPPAKITGDKAAALSLKNATTLTELPAVVYYICALVPEGQALLGAPGDAFAKARVDEWMAWLVGHVQGKSYMAAMYGVNDEHKAAGMQWLLDAFKRIDGKLAGKKFAAGDALTVADIMLYYTYRLSLFAGIGNMATEYPDFTAFAKGIEALPSVRTVVAYQELSLLFA